MTTYKCINCGYKIKKESIPKSCNYCSKENCMKEIENADQILDMV